VTKHGCAALAIGNAPGRLALTLRAGANEAFFVDTGARSAAATFTAGVAIY
jgi:hypothetical protein